MVAGRPRPAQRLRWSLIAGKCWPVGCSGVTSAPWPLPPSFECQCVYYATHGEHCWGLENQLSMRLVLRITKVAAARVRFPKVVPDVVGKVIFHPVLKGYVAAPPPESLYLAIELITPHALNLIWCCHCHPPAPRGKSTKIAATAAHFCATGTTSLCHLPPSWVWCAAASLPSLHACCGMHVTIRTLLRTMVENSGLL